MAARRQADYQPGNRPQPQRWDFGRDQRLWLHSDDDEPLLLALLASSLGLKAGQQVVLPLFGLRQMIAAIGKPPANGQAASATLADLVAARVAEYRRGRFVLPRPSCRGYFGRVLFFQ